MTPRTKRKLKGAAGTVVFFVLTALVWDLFMADPDDGLQPFLAVIVGVLISFPLIFFESSAILADRFRRMPFAVGILAKAVTYGVTLTSIFLGTGFIAGASRGLTMADFRESLPQMLGATGTAFVGYLVVIFVRQLNSLLGPGVLLRFIRGRYHAPRRERRIFMFVDLEGSTELSLELSLEHYYGLVNDFFHDVGGPVIDAEGEIYEYVGDEVVISWPHESGLRNANCVRAFFAIREAVQRRAQDYRARYGRVPRFKAGLHEGEVIVAEMGGLKKTIAFNGEVLNVTARIQGECNRLGQRLLASRELVDQLSLPDDLSTTSMGRVELRGAGSKEIVALA